jgi:ribosome-binding factor A
MSRDLQQARVYYTGPDSETDRRDTTRALRRTRPYLRRQLAQRLKLRHVPELAFEYDESAVRQDRIARIFDKIAAERPVDSDPESISPEEP